jgi:hypothetical protein
MKKKIMNILSVLVLAATLSSCATLFCGPVSTCQRTRPAAGQPAREVRVVALVLDIVLFWPSVAVDFATSAIYRPCESK